MKSAMGKTQNNDIKDMLRVAGYKATRPRLLLLRALREAQKPLAVADLHSKIGMSNIDQATIYRTMHDFVHAGIVSRIDTGHAHAHFELSRDHHHHLICKSCHKIEDIDICYIPKTAKETLRQATSFASIDAHTLEFFGLCKYCKPSLHV